MTVLQLRAVLLTVEFGSISAAAKELKISQPNASSSIRLLEEEIGFAIFHRTSTGAILTQKGTQFLQYARGILEQNEKIMALRNASEIYRLRVGCIYYFPAVKAFLQLAALHREDPIADFRFYTLSIAEGLGSLLRRETDIVLATVLPHQISGLVSECSRNNLCAVSVGRIPAVVALRRDHPAVLDGRCKSLTQGSDAMKEFPYIAYRSLSQDTSSTGYNDSDFVQCSYKMYVDDIDTKLRLLAATNGFSFGIRTTNESMAAYGLTSFAVPGVSSEMFAVTRPGESERKEIAEFTEGLKAEIKRVIQ